MNRTIISSDKSIIPACDVATLEDFEKIVRATCDLDGIGGYKVGFELGLGFGLSSVVDVARRYTSKPIIYDHQKGGNDIPEMGVNFAGVCKRGGIEAIILFPFTGPVAQMAWVNAAQDKDLGVIVGGWMTHNGFAQSEGGYISDEGALRIYQVAAQAGVNHFVVPGNKLDVLGTIRSLVEAEGVEPVFYSPGFVAQGGKIDAAVKIAGDRYHPIVGRGIYLAPSLREAALKYTKMLE